MLSFSKLWKALMGDRSQGTHVTGRKKPNFTRLLVEVLEDRIVPSTVTVANIQDGSESGTNGIFRVSRGDSACNLVVYYTFDADSSTATSTVDFSAFADSVTILAGNTSADINVVIIDDSAVEDSETVKINLTGGSCCCSCCGCCCGGGSYTIGSPSTATLTIADDDTPNMAPSFAGGNITVSEDSGAYSGTWATSISAGPPNESGQTLTFIVQSNSNPNLFSAAPGIAADGTLTFTPADDAFGSATVTIVLQDDGGTAYGGVDTSLPYTFTLTITSVNDVPNFSAGGDITVSEDSGAYAGAWASAISTGPANEGQTPSFTVSNDNGSLFSAAPSIAANGTLTFTTAADAFGSATVTVSLSDGIDATIPVTFTLTITSVKATPTITWSNPADIFYGSALNSTQLNATANVAGMFVYAPALGTIFEAGTQTLLATFTPANTNDYETVTKTVSININKAPLTVTADNQSKTYGDANPTLTATITGFVNGENGTVLSGTAGLSTTADNTSVVGTYTIMSAIGTLAASNYNFSFTDGTLTVNKATLAVTADNQTKTYGSTLTFVGNEFTATGLVGLDSIASVTFTSSGAVATATVAGSPFAIVPNNATGEGLANYTISYVNGALTVNKATLTVTADNQSKTYGDANPTLTATIIGFVNGEDGSVVSGSTGLSTTADNTSVVGTYTITSAIGTLAASNYTFSFTDGTLTVNKATLAVTADNASKVWGENDPASFSATYTGLVNGDSAASFTGALSRINGEDAGTYPINQGTLVATGNYTIGMFVPGVFTITAINVTNSAPVISSVMLDKSTPTTNETLTATVVGSDADGDAITYQYAWYVNNVTVPETSATLDLSQASYGNKGDSIYVTVTPSDAINSGAAFSSGTVTVANSAPVISSVTLDNLDPRIDDCLTAQVLGAFDADSDPVTFQYTWAVNGQVVQITSSADTTDWLDLSQLSSVFYEDMISVSVMPSDPTDSGSAVSAFVRVGFRAPSVVNITAYRPQTVPFLPTPVPAATEDTIGAGIRSNGDDDDGDGISDWNDPQVAGENDLIEITLDFGAQFLPRRTDYFLSRSNANIKVWDSKTKGGAVLDANDVAQLAFAPGSSLWVEWVNPTEDSADAILTFESHHGLIRPVVRTDSVRMFRFTSVVIVIGGRTQVPSDPPSSQEGVFVVGTNVYANEAYDVHMFAETAQVSAGALTRGTGGAYDEVVNAVNNRRVSYVSIFGFSWGGGATYNLADRLGIARAEGLIQNPFTIPYTAYIDAVQHDVLAFGAAEVRRPPASQFHVNYYQNNMENLIRGAPVALSDFELNVTTETIWGAMLVHITIDDDIAGAGRNVLDGVRVRLLLRVTR